MTRKTRQTPVEALDSTSGYDQRGAGNGLHGDAPVTHLSDDLFGRGELVARLADLIVTSPKDESLCVAVSAPWGSGKSSFLNFLEESLCEPNSESMPLLVRFNPWQYPSMQDLARLFF